ncbi:MAG: hypothetical protein GY701_26035, partial [Sulfitobacter sp.]|nr:hypothetical protein [Sulfitobacter sp.]
MYDELAATKISYSDEPIGGTDGAQPIQPPHEVLDSTNPTGTCLDIAVTAAALCLSAGLHPWLLESGGHVVLAVWIGSDDVSPDATNWNEGPGSAYPYPDGVTAAKLDPTEVLGTPDAPGTVVALDIVGVAHGEREDAVTFETSLRQGHQALLRWLDEHADGTLRVCDVGVAWRRVDQLNPGRGWPVGEPLFPATPFDDPTGVKNPARLTRSQYRVVPYQRNDTFTVTLDRTRSAAETQGAHVWVIHGEGGSGKTRLAGELAIALEHEGWLAGVLRRDTLGRHPQAGGLDLSRVAATSSPLFVAVDYADAYSSGELEDLVARTAGPRRGPAFIILLARTAGGWWETLHRSLANSGLPVDTHVFDALPPVPKGARSSIWLAAIKGFERVLRHGVTDEIDDSDPERQALPPSGKGQTWTALDLTLLAWLAVATTVPLPTTKAELYDLVIEHEYDYWRTTAASADATAQDLFEAWGARLTLTSPRERADARRVAPGIGDEALTAFGTVWAGGWQSAASDEGVALRPDSVGDHLILRHFGTRVEELAVLIVELLVGDDRMGHAALGALLRLETNGGAAEEFAADVCETLGTSGTHGALAVARLALAGSSRAATCVERHVAESDPSAELLHLLAFGVPERHILLDSVALKAALRLAGQTEHLSPDQVSRVLSVTAARLSSQGDIRRALGYAQKALAVARDLADTNPVDTDRAAFTPDLATSLNN